MAFIRDIYAECIKMRHTPLFWMHIIFPILGAVLFLFYAMFYSQVDFMTKSVFILELAAVVFPILIGTICGMAALSEEHAGSFQVMLGCRRTRQATYLAKLSALILNGAAAMGLLIGLYVLGISFMPASDRAIINMTLKLAASIFAGDMILYVICLFCSMKWGLGVSVFTGIVSSLFVIMFSNFDAITIGYYIPFVWGINFFKGLLEAYANNAPAIAAFFPNVQAGSFVVLFSIISTLLCLRWFSRWEGRVFLAG